MMAACAGSATAQASADSATHAAVASERALNGRITARRTMAVLPFTVTATDTSLLSLGFGLAEFLSDDLAHSHRLLMVERARLSELQREMRLTATGIVDRATAVRVGQLITARTLVIGAIDATDAGRVTIDARAVDVETGAVGMHHSQTSELESIFGAERDLVMETFAAFGITLTPDERRSLYERIAPQFRAFLSFSRGVRAENQGNDELAAASYQEASALDRTFKLPAARLAAVRARLISIAATVMAGKDVAKPSAGELTKEAGAIAAKTKAAEGRPVGGSAPEGAATPSKTAGTATTPTTTPAKKTSNGPKRFVRKPPAH